MKNFIADLWNDLREKRLWPVAVVLLAGLVAVPLVLSKSSQEPPASAPKAVAGSAKPKAEDAGPLASVKLEEGETSEGSSLDTFDPDDPFRPPAKVLTEGREESSSDTVSAPPTDSGGSTGDSSGGGSGSSGGDIGSSGGTTDSGTSGGGTTGANGGGTTTRYAYVIDVTLDVNGRTRKVKGVERLDMLPSQASPLLLFLGVSSNRGNAVFLVDATLHADGEGKCKPSKTECGFLHLGAGSEHTFTNDEGDSYELRVDEIRKVKVGSQGTTANAATGAATKASASTPRITRVSPMRTSVGKLLTISGRDFKAVRKANTVIFRGPNGRTAFAKPRRATRTKLVVAVPAAVSLLLNLRDNLQQPTRLTLRVLAGRLSKHTPRRLSPVVTGVG